MKKIFLLLIIICAILVSLIITTRNKNGIIEENNRIDKHLIQNKNVYVLNVGDTFQLNTYSNITVEGKITKWINEKECTHLKLIKKYSKNNYKNAEGGGVLLTHIF